MRARDEVYAECDLLGFEYVRDKLSEEGDDPERLHRLEWMVSKFLTRENTSLLRRLKGAPSECINAVGASLSNDVPIAALSLYGRWWQLETWIRDLVRVELVAAFGQSWGQHLPPNSETRQAKEKAYQHMPTPDVQSRLAYADASALFKITQDHWPYFEHALFSKAVWAGRVEELLAIRNRIGHCRRPHSDDLARLEQMLRDLNDGAQGAVSAFNARGHVSEDWNDPLVDAWVHRGHEVASRLGTASFS